MIAMKRIMLVLIAVAAVISGCKTVEGTTNRNRLTEKVVLKKMAGNSVDFESFSARIKTNFESEEESFSATLQVKIEKDKQIWISGQKFGFEGVRLLIRQDSIQIINRLDKTYQVTDFTYLQEEFNLPADFNSIQEMLMGNPLTLSENAVYQLKSDTSEIILNGVDDNFICSFFLNNTSFLLEKMLLIDQNEDRQVVIEQGDYQLTDKNGMFSYLRKVALESEEEAAQVTMTFSKVEFGKELSMSFSIPKSYERL